MSDLKDNSLKAFMDALDPYERAARRCIKAARQRPDLKSSEQGRFLHDLPYTVIGALNARDISLTRKNIERALDIPFVVNEDDVLTGTRTQPEADNFEIVDEGDMQPVAEDPQMLQQLLDAVGQESSAEEDDAFMIKFKARMREHEQIESAIASGFRGYLNLPAEASDAETIKALRGKTADALKWQLESGHPGITTNPDHDLWAEPLMLLDALRRENIIGMKKTAAIPALLLDDALLDDDVKTEEKTTPLPQKPPGGMTPP